MSLKLTFAMIGHFLAVAPIWHACFHCDCLNRRLAGFGPVLCITTFQKAPCFPRMLADGFSSLMESAMRTTVSHTNVLI
jgi:hypothetical protein